jgi:hypothetical protein
MARFKAMAITALKFNFVLPANRRVPLASPNHSHPAKYPSGSAGNPIPGNKRPKHNRAFLPGSAALPLSNGHLRPRSKLRSQSDRQDSNLHMRINEVTLVFATGKSQSGNHRQEVFLVHRNSCRFAPNRS